MFTFIDSVHKLYKFVNTRPLVIIWFQRRLSESFITRANHECMVFILYAMFMAERAQSITIINFRLNPSSPFNQKFVAAESHFYFFSFFFVEKITYCCRTRRLSVRLSVRPSRRLFVHPPSFVEISLDCSYSTSTGITARKFA